MYPKEHEHCSLTMYFFMSNRKKTVIIYLLSNLSDCIVVLLLNFTYSHSHDHVPRYIAKPQIDGKRWDLRSNFDTVFGFRFPVTVKVPGCYSPCGSCQFIRWSISGKKYFFPNYFYYRVFGKDLAPHIHIYNASKRASRCIHVIWHQNGTTVRKLSRNGTRLSSYIFLT